MGKTLFVRNDLVPAAEAWGWRACYIDLWVRRDHPEVALVEELEAAARPKGLVSKAIKPDKVTAKAAYAGSGYTPSGQRRVRKLTCKAGSEPQCRIWRRPATSRFC